MSKHDGLFQNSVYNVIYKLLDALFPLVSAAYLGRVLMSDGVGKVAYAQNIAQYFVLAASLGIPNYGIREIARRRKDEEQTKELFSSLFFINLISTLICTALYYAGGIQIYCNPQFCCKSDLTCGNLCVYPEQ